MKSMTAEKSKAGKKSPENADVTAPHYARKQTAEHAAICNALRGGEIDAALPKAAPQLCK